MPGRAWLSCLRFNFPSDPFSSYENSSEQYTKSTGAFLSFERGSRGIAAGNHLLDGHGPFSS